MDLPASLLVSLICLAMSIQVRSMQSIIGMYGETIEVPCNNGAPPPEQLYFTKWKYEKDDGTPGDLLIKHGHKDEPTVQARDEYQHRIDIAANYSLLISEGTLADQKLFTCMVVSGGDLAEYPVNVLVYKTPSAPLIRDKAKQLENGKMTMLGVCDSMDANPAAAITWSKNGQPLVDNGKTVVIGSSVKVDPLTGLSSTTSTLEYTADKGDKGAQFTCISTNILGQQESVPEMFSIHYPTENVVLQVSPATSIREGDNVTLTCEADGNPPPSGFNFHLKGQMVTVTDSDTFVLSAVTRADAGEYKCSLLDDDLIESSRDISISFLDLSLSPRGKVLRTVGDALEVRKELTASGNPGVTWTKDGKRVDEPGFSHVTYGDAGLYVCEVAMDGIKRSQHFELVVEGKPVIKSLTRQRSEDGTHKILICEAEGAPQPSVQWSVNGTDEQTSYLNGKATHKITVVPTANLTVSCIVSNKLGEDVMAINISSSTVDEISQAPLIVGILVGLIIAAALVGLIYCIYIKKSRQGSWKTGEKEAGTSEESKKLEEKLEENNHTKLDV